MRVDENEFLAQLAAFDERADEMTESTIRVLAFVAADSARRKLERKEYREAQDDARMMLAALEALSRRAAQ